MKSSRGPSRTLAVLGITEPEWPSTTHSLRQTKLRTTTQTRTRGRFRHTSTKRSPLPWIGSSECRWKSPVSLSMTVTALSSTQNHISRQQCGTNVRRKQHCLSNAESERGLPAGLQTPWGRRGMTETMNFLWSKLTSVRRRSSSTRRKLSEGCTPKKEKTSKSCTMSSKLGDLTKLKRLKLLRSSKRMRKSLLCSSCCTKRSKSCSKLTALKSKRAARTSLRK